MGNYGSSNSQHRHHLHHQKRMKKNRSVRFNDGNNKNNENNNNHGDNKNNHNNNNDDDDRYINKQIYEVDYIARELISCYWYSKSELNDIKNKNKSLAKDINDGKIVMEGKYHTGRGLDVYLKTNSNLKKDHIKKGWNAVMKVQKLQKDEDIIYNPDTIAILYRSKGMALKCREYAIARALEDYKYVKEIKKTENIRKKQ